MKIKMLKVVREWTVSTLIPLVRLFFQLKPALTAGQGEQVAITGWTQWTKTRTRTNGHVTQTSSSLGPCPGHSKARNGEDSEEPFDLGRDPGGTARYRLSWVECSLLSASNRNLLQGQKAERKGKGRGWIKIGTGLMLWQARSSINLVPQWVKISHLK